MSDGTPQTAAVEMLIELNGYIEKAIAPVLAPSLSLTFNDRMSNAFNAEVSTADFNRFNISINRGCADLLNNCMAGAEAEDLTEVQAALSATLFDDLAHALEVRRAMLHFAIVFIAFHEIAHVLCGHLPFCFDREIIGMSKHGLRLDEVTTLDPDPTRDAKATNWAKLIELDADQMAFELLMAFAYEILVAGDGFAELLPDKQDPNAVSQRTALALGEVIITSAASVFFLMEMQRGDHGDYPTPQTRLQSILYTWTRQLLVNDQERTSGDTVTISQTQRSELFSKVLPACFNAAQFGMACAEALTDEPAGKTYKANVGFDETALMDEFMDSLVQTGSASPDAPEQSFRKLMRELTDFQQMLRRHPLGS